MEEFWEKPIHAGQLGRHEDSYILRAHKRMMTAWKLSKTGPIHERDLNLAEIGRDLADIGYLGTPEALGRYTALAIPYVESLRERDPRKWRILYGEFSRRLSVIHLMTGLQSRHPNIIDSPRPDAVTVEMANLLERKGWGPSDVISELGLGFVPKGVRERAPGEYIRLDGKRVLDLEGAAERWELGDGSPTYAYPMQGLTLMERARPQTPTRSSDGRTDRSAGLPFRQVRDPRQQSAVRGGRTPFTRGPRPGSGTPQPQQQRRPSALGHAGTIRASRERARSNALDRDGGSRAPAQQQGVGGPRSALPKRPGRLIDDFAWMGRGWTLLTGGPGLSGLSDEELRRRFRNRKRT